MKVQTKARRKALADVPASGPKQRVRWWSFVALAAAVLVAWRGGLFRLPEKPVILPSVIAGSEPEKPTTGTAPKGEPGARPISLLLPKTTATGPAPVQDLHLSAPQQSTLRGLSVQEDAETAAIMRQVDSDRSDLDAYILRAKGKGGVSLADLESHAAPLSADSALLRRQREELWARAMQILTPDQRKIAESMQAPGPAGPSDHAPSTPSDHAAPGGQS